MRRLAAILLTLCLCCAAPGFPASADSGLPAASDGAPEAEASPEPSPAPSASPEPDVTPSPRPEQVKLVIDNRNVYEKMERSYSQGYVPTVKNGTAEVVLPLICQGELAGGQLRARADLGEGGPFVTKNYEKTVELKENWVNAKKGKVQGYLAAFSLQLVSGRVNGSYPVRISIAAKDLLGAEVQETFTVYVTVSDGRDPNATPPPEPTPEPVPDPTPAPVVLGPKVLVASSRALSLEEGAESGIVKAGDRFRVTAVLVNTSQTEALENMAVSAAPPEGFALLSESDSVYIGSLAAGGTVEVSYDYTAKPETPAGQYPIALTYDYAYHGGETASGTGTARVEIRQPLRLEFSLSQLPGEAVISDTVEVIVQAVNLSHAKAYHVRAVLEADGLSPSGTALIGDLEGGTSGEKPLRILITGLTQSEFSYGRTGGKITYLYEDEEGNELSQEENFTMEIKSPFSETKSQEVDDPGQWWLIMAGIGAAAAVLGGVFLWRAVKRRRE